MAITITDTALLRLLQLSSAALPVGGFAFSQGMESAIEAGWLTSGDDSAEWLSLQLHESLAAVDLPILIRQLQATRCGDQQRLGYWNDYLLACRETAELRLTDTAMGAALMRLLTDLQVPLPLTTDNRDISFVSAFAMAAAHWQLPTGVALNGYVWSWLENQVAAATKLVPLGQTRAQQLLGELLPQVAAALDRAESLDDGAIGASLPALALASCWHETQYSRLFRS